MDCYDLRVELTHTGYAIGHEVPVPLVWETMRRVRKDKPVGESFRKELHELLDHWIDEIHRAPDQHGSRMPAAFTLSYQGDTPDWVDMQTQEAIKAKETIRARLEELIKLATK